MDIKFSFGDFSFELNGDDQKVLELFNEIKSNGFGKLIDSISNSKSNVVNDIPSATIEEKDKEGVIVPASLKKKHSRNKLSVVTEFDPDFGKPRALQDFITSLKTTRSLERITAIVYYLTNKNKDLPITPDIIFSCFSSMPNVTNPNNLYDRIYDCTRFEYSFLRLENNVVTLLPGGRNKIDQLIKEGRN